MVFNFSPPFSPPVHLSLTFYFYFKHTSMQPVSFNLINIPYHIRNLSRMSCMVAIRMRLPFYAPGGHGDSPNKDRKCQLPNKHPCMSSSTSLYSEYKFCTFVSPSNAPSAQPQSYQLLQFLDLLILSLKQLNVSSMYWISTRNKTQIRPLVTHGLKQAMIQNCTLKISFSVSQSCRSIGRGFAVTPSSALTQFKYVKKRLKPLNLLGLSCKQWLFKHLFSIASSCTKLCQALVLHLSAFCPVVQSLHPSLHFNTVKTHFDFVRVWLFFYHLFLSTPLPLRPVHLS